MTHGRRPQVRRGGFLAATLALVLTTQIQAMAPDAQAREAAPTQLRSEDCRQQIGVFPIDEAQAAAYLPDGFLAVPFQDSSPGGASGLAAPPGATATVQLVATSCTRVVSGLAKTEGFSVAQAWLYVQPPDEFRDDRLGPTPSPYAVVPWMTVSSAELARRLRAWGLPARLGSVGNAFDGVPGALQLGSVHAEVDGLTVNLESVVPVAHRETTPEHLRLFGVKDRQLTGIVDFVEDEHTHLLVGKARLTVDAGSPAFPVPTTSGVGIHVESGYGVTWQQVETSDTKGRP